MSKKEMKITDEQLEKVRAQQSVKGRIINDIGVLEAQKHDLLHALTNVMQKSVETAEELEKEYGKININLEDGSYEVVEVEEAEDKAETKEEEKEKEEVVEEK